MKGIDRGALIRIDEVLRYIAADRYMDKSESAQYLGVGVRTFEGWMDQIPKYRPGRKLLFKKSELDAFNLHAIRTIRWLGPFPRHQSSSTGTVYGGGS